jgi:hypothetical protein
LGASLDLKQAQEKRLQTEVGGGQSRHAETGASSAVIKIAMVSGGNDALEVVWKKMNQPDLAPSMETRNHWLTLLRKAINGVHNFANQLSAISFGLITRNSRSTKKSANDHRGAKKPMAFPSYKQRNNLDRLN